jgi:hypothetical protein|tara:strand:- start:449 stop:769 length:321 start_codon:yes stop_codon:yes gene_type:complete
MAFKLKRHRKKRKKKLSKKDLLLKKLALAKKKLKKTKFKIKSVKLNNNQQNETTVLSRKGKIQNGKPSKKAKDIYVGDENLESLTIGHVTSTTGSYRRGRIANFKN